MPARPTLLATAGALVALAVACVLSLLVGARTIPLDSAWQALVAFDPTTADHAVLANRLQRTLAGLAVGVALALAGAGLQGMTRNPLADPGILGLNSGAAAAVATGVYLFSFSSVTQFMAAGFVGAALAPCSSTHWPPRAAPAPPRSPSRSPAPPSPRGSAPSSTPW